MVEEGSMDSWYGNKILFTSNASGGAANPIMVMDSDGSNKQTLLSDGAYNYRATWSHDGAKICFKSKASGNEELYLMDPDGSNIIRLTYSGDGYSAHGDIY